MYKTLLSLNRFEDQQPTTGPPQMTGYQLLRVIGNAKAKIEITARTLTAESRASHHDNVTSFLISTLISFNLTSVNILLFC